MMLELNKLYLMDCLEGMKNIPLGLVDMVLTDPPYGTTACKWDSIIPLEPMWEQLKRVIKPNGAIVMTASQPFTTTLIASNMKMFKYCWVWEKERPSNPAIAKKRPLKYTEDVVVFYINHPIYNPQMIRREEKNKRNNKNERFSTEASASLGDSFKKQGLSDWCYPKDALKVNVQRGLHPTQKPVALMEYLIKTYTNEGELVLDFTMGSGTTAIACINTNRNWIGFEIDEDYYKAASERIEIHQMQTKLF